MPREPTPFISHPWWRRALYGFGVGALAAAVASGVTLLSADIAGERARSRVSSAGTPLWPVVRSMAIVFPPASASISCLLVLAFSTAQAVRPLVAADARSEPGASAGGATR